MGVSLETVRQYHSRMLDALDKILENEQEAMD